MTTTENQVIPDANNVTAQGGGKSWRVANGKFVRGQEIVKQVEVDGKMAEVKTGNYPEEMTKIVGALRRVGIYQANHERYGPQHKLEADIETSKGLQIFSLTLLDTNGQFKVGVSALMLAWSLLQFAKDEILMLETQLGEPVTLPNGQKGGRPTYVNPYRVEGNKGVPIYRPKRDKSAPSQTAEQQWVALEAQLRAHPAFGDRPASREDDEEGRATTHLSALCKECQEKGWPTPEQNPAGWLALMAKGFGHETRARLSDYRDDEWGEVRQAYQQAKECPAILLPAPTQGSFSAV